MNRKSRTNVWIMTAVGLAGMAWLLWDFRVKGAAIMGNDGVAGFIAHATFQHKLGELFIFLPLFVAAMLAEGRSWAAARHWLWRTWPATILGSALNLLAWMNSSALPWHDPNRLWFGFLVLAGLVASPLLIRLGDRRAR